MARINHRDHCQVKRGFVTKKAARDYERAQLDKLAYGLIGVNPNMTFRDLAERFDQDYIQMRLKPSSAFDYRQAIKNHLMPVFGKKKLVDITIDDVQRLIRAKLKKGLSPRTTAKIVTLLGTMLTQGVRWGYLKENVVRYVDKPRVLDKEMDFLRPGEVKQLLDACDLNFLPHVATAALTGMRQGEQLALAWDDISFEEQVIRIKRTVGPGGIIGSPKSAAGTRTIPLTPMLAAILEEHKVRSGGAGPDLVFPGHDGGYMKSHTLTKQFKRILAEAELRQIRWHDLRHSFASLMLSLGESILFVQRMLGHSKPSTTLNRYGHLVPEASFGIGSKLDSLIFESSVEIPEEVPQTSPA